MSPSIINPLIFVLCYGLFVLFQRRRSWIACGGAIVLIVVSATNGQDAFSGKIAWNVVALFFGMQVLAELFTESRVPAALAEWFISRTSTARGAMLALCLLSGAISAVAENVAVVLLIAPIALSLAEKLKISPVKLLIGIAISSNLQGTATLVGDSTSMILASHMKMNFMDFFVYHGRPGVFFPVQAGAAAGIIVLAWLFRAHGETFQATRVEEVQTWFPTLLLGLLLPGLCFSSIIDPDFAWFSGFLALGLALGGLAWRRICPQSKARPHFFRLVDWDTLFFLMGVFVLVGGLSDSGWLDKIAAGISRNVAGNLGLAYISIITLAVVVSAFVDNIPFLLAMIPVVQQVADNLQAPVPLLMFGLLIGTCLGGNITPIGASANVVTIGILRRHGYTVSFREFIAVGLPFTLAAVVAATLTVWLIWAP